MSDKFEQEKTPQQFGDRMWGFGKFNVLLSNISNVMKKFLKNLRCLWAKQLSVFAIVGAATILLSCDKELERVNADSGQNQRSARLKNANYRVAAAKILAKAVYNEEVRKLLKKEALKKFDGDYDVLFQLVKNNQIDNKRSLLTYLSSLASSPEEFKEIIDNLPLLTVYVPTFFDARKWNTTNQIPIVAVRDEKDNLIAYNKEGEFVELSSKEEPNLPIIVVKNSDKVITKALDTKSGAKKNAETFIFNNGKEDFYFIDESLNNINPASKSARKVALSFGANEFDPLVVEAYNKANGCDYCTQRDWIYYGIDARSGPASGRLNTKFEEAITAIEFTSIDGLNVVGGWDEGTFIFKLNATFGLRNNATASPIEKTVPVDPAALLTYHEEIRHRGIFGVNTYTVRIADGVKTFTPSSPITFVPWDMEIYGDRWAVIAEEYDQSVTIVKTYENTVTYGANFSATVGSKEKLGATFGASATVQNKTTTSYTSTEGNDALGNAVITWIAPVLTNYQKNYVAIEPMVANTYELNTGTLRLSFESVRTSP